FRDVIRRGLALDIRAERQDYFGRMLASHSANQCGDSQIVGADVIERGDASSERMILPAENARPFNRQNVGWLLDHAEQGIVAIRRSAEIAERFGSKEAALWAGMDLVADN